MNPDIVMRIATAKVLEAHEIFRELRSTVKLEHSDFFDLIKNVEEVRDLFNTMWNSLQEEIHGEEV